MSNKSKSETWAEREEWKKFWTEVDAMRSEAEAGLARKTETDPGKNPAK